MWITVESRNYNKLHSKIMWSVLITDRQKLKYIEALFTVSRRFKIEVYNCCKKVIFFIILDLELF
jgi:hypothetical protein